MSVDSDQADATTSRTSMPSSATSSRASAAIAHAHLLGYSFGCQVSAELAARRAELVERLVLQGPTVDPSAHGWPQLGRWFVNSVREGMTQPNETFGQWAKAGPRVFARTSDSWTSTASRTCFRRCKRRHS